MERHGSAYVDGGQCIGPHRGRVDPERLWRWDVRRTGLDLNLDHIVTDLPDVHPALVGKHVDVDYILIRRVFGNGDQQRNGLSQRRVRAVSPDVMLVGGAHR